MSREPAVSTHADRKNRVFLGIVVVLGILVVAGLGDRLSDMLFYPWARAEPPLLRSWVGRLTTGNGVPLALGMTLRRARTRRGTPCAKCNQIEGIAVTCDARGTLLRYRVSGSPSDRQGRQLHLGAVPEPDPPPEGLELDVLRGSWDGDARLDLEADFFWRRGGAGVSSTDDPATQPVPLQMSPADEPSIDRICSLFTRRAG
jgi:hypothetical protein